LCGLTILTFTDLVPLNSSTINQSLPGTSPKRFSKSPSRVRFVWRKCYQLLLHSPPPCCNSLSYSDCFTWRRSASYFKSCSDRTVKVVTFGRMWEQLTVYMGQCSQEGALMKHIAT